MTTSSGLFSRSDFYGKNILKLAPDAFIVVNGQMDAKFISPYVTGGSDNLDTRGGVTSINITAAISPPGSNQATIEIVAPMYKGLHEDYYVTMPNGTKRIFFTPLMEIKVYMKGYYLVDGNPSYYPAFWGMIVNISEDYHDGFYTFSLTCKDLLSWWNYQMLTVNPSATQGLFANVTPNHFPSIFQAMNPWQIIWHLFVDSDFTTGDSEAPYNFVYPDISSTAFAPEFGSMIGGDTKLAQKVFRNLAQGAMAYWRSRFGYDSSDPQSNPDRIPLQMFGLAGPINLDLSDNLKYLSDYPLVSPTEVTRADIQVDFSLMAYMQPYGALNLYSGGAEAQEHTKLEIATEICNQTQMEFFVDTNGMVVFKPPFYNLDVTKGGTQQYIINAGDVITFNSSINSNEICTYLEVTSPLYQTMPDLNAKGVHIDYDLLKQYGLRYQKIAMRYGDNPHVLRLLAAAEMAKMNGRAYQGSVSIPLRPEIRMGYPVYLSHIDAYYYVTGISHSFSYGSSATTTLSLEYRRDRIFDDGTITGKEGTVLKKYVYRTNIQDSQHTVDNTGEFDAATSANVYNTNNANAQTFAAQINQLEKNPDAVINIQSFQKYLASLGLDTGSNSLLYQITRKGTDESEDRTVLIKKLQGLVNDKLKERSLMNAGLVSGPSNTGFYSITPAKNVATTVTATRTDNKDASFNNESIMITTDTVPYTDLNGYRHIGGFPYGANLLLAKNGTTMANTIDAQSNVTNKVDTLTSAASTTNNNNQISTPPISKNNPATYTVSSSQNSHPGPLTVTVTSYITGYDVLGRPIYAQSQGRQGNAALYKHVPGPPDPAQLTNAKS